MQLLGDNAERKKLPAYSSAFAASPSATEGWWDVVSVGVNNYLIPAGFDFPCSFFAAYF